MQEILIGPDKGGFHITNKAVKYLVILGLPEAYEILNRDKVYTEHNMIALSKTTRDDKRLILCYKFLVEEFSISRVGIVKVPEDIDWELKINIPSGNEFVYEKHRYWKVDSNGETKEGFG